jgi:hypothetical protein
MALVAAMFETPQSCWREPCRFHTALFCCGTPLTYSSSSLLLPFTIACAVVCSLESCPFLCTTVDFSIIVPPVAP